MDQQASPHQRADMSQDHAQLVDGWAARRGMIKHPAIMTPQPVYR